MTRAGMRTLLRRRLQDATSFGSSENWSDAELNDLLNQACVPVQKAVLKQAPLAFMAIDKQDIEANNEFYAKPDGFWYEQELQILDPTSGRYSRIGKQDGMDADARGDGTTKTVWSDFGGYVKLSPVPSATIVFGLRWLYVTSLTMSDDDNSPKVHAGLHMAIVYEAQKLAWGETGASKEEKDELYGLLAAEYADIPLYYRADATPDRIVLPEVTRR